jgi:guanylate kinase
LNLKKASERAVLIFILPPSFEILERRLRGRQTDSEEEILKRLRNARNELNFAEKYDYVVLNEELDTTIAAIRDIIQSEHHSTRHQRVAIVP